MIKQIKSKLPAIKKIFKKHKVVFGYFFGSYVKGHAGKLSDLDFAAYLKKRPSSLNTQLKIMGELGELFKNDRIDLVILNEADPPLAHQVIISGFVLYDSDPEERFNFERKTLQTFEDMKCFTEVSFKYLADRIHNNKMGVYPR